jgi:hypothetical protein
MQEKLQVFLDRWILQLGCVLRRARLLESTGAFAKDLTAPCFVQVGADVISFTVPAYELIQTLADGIYGISLSVVTEVGTVRNELSQISITYE